MSTPSTVSADTLTLWEQLPQFVQDAEADNGYPFLTWLDGIGSQLQTIDNLARDSGADPGWSIIMDATRCPTAGLPWLGQLLGVRFSSTQVTDAQQRAAIETPQGFQRGTVAAIEAAANALLNTGYSATVLERDPDAYSLIVQIPSAGLTGGTWGELVAAEATWADVVTAYSDWAALTAQSTSIEAACKAAKPAGLLMTFSYV